MEDALSEVLRSVRLSGGVFLEARFTEPWCIVSQITPQDCRAFMAMPAQIIAFHFVIDGRMWLGTDGDQPIEFAAGEVAVLPRNDRHTLGSNDGVEPISADDLIRPGPDGGLPRIDYGGSGARSRIICGFLASDDGVNALIASLPAVLKLDFRKTASRDWIEASLRLAAQQLEEGQVASSNLISRLSELLFVEAVRKYAMDLGDHAKGWLGGINDVFVGRALTLIHRSLNTQWTAEKLADEVNLSRSAFVERFTARVGMPPIRYLTHWRLQTARHLLRETQKNVAQIAYEVGYDSEAAFSRAFKREFGVAPKWSRHR